MGVHLIAITIIVLGKKFKAVIIEPAELQPRYTRCRVHQWEEIIAGSNILKPELTRLEHNTPHANAASDLYPGPVDLHLELEYADNLYLVLQLDYCAHAESTWPVVNRCDE